MVGEQEKEEKEDEREEMVKEEGERTARRRTLRGEHNIARRKTLLLPLLPFIKVITGTDFPANAWVQVRIEYCGAPRRA